MGRNSVLRLHHASWHQQRRTIISLKKKVWPFVFGIKRFHQHLFGHHFVILSDHKPQKHIFKASSAMRWSLILGSYDYTIEYKQGDRHANAECLSRLPLPTAPDNVPLTLHLCHQPKSSSGLPKILFCQRLQILYDMVAPDTKQLSPYH